jgi:hypothetical protein
MIKKLKTVMSSWAVIMVAIVTAVVAVSVPAYASGNANLYVQELNPMVVGGTVTFQIRLNTNGSHINAVEADFTYPTSVLTFVSIDTPALSAFPTDASDTGGAGSVAIARGVSGSLGPTGISGDFKIANVTFNVVGSGAANLIFQGSSAADDAVTNLNDLGSTTNGTFGDFPGMYGGQTLTAGNTITSGNGLFIAAMQTDGNFVIYGSGKALWATHTAGANAYATMQTDGNFVIYSSTNAPLWSSRSYGPGSNLVLQNDGNLVIYNPHGRAIWSRTSGVIMHLLLTNHSLQPGDFLEATNGQYSAAMQSDGNFVVYNASGHPLWSSKTSSPGAVMVMQSDGNMVLYNTLNRPIWSTRSAGSGVVAVIQTDSNLVLYNSAGKAIWSRLT